MSYAGFMCLPQVHAGLGRKFSWQYFTAITQGILLAGLSTYVNQIIKQIGREE